MDKISLASYGLSKDELDRNLSEYYEKINNHKAVKSMLEKKFASVEDYVDILYILKFVRKYNNTEMGELTGDRFFYKAYMQAGLHWEYSTNDFIECQRLFEAELARLHKYQQETYSAESNAYFATEEYTLFYNKVFDNIPNSFLKHCNYPLSKDCFVKEIYYLWNIKKVSLRELAVLYGRTNSIFYQLFSKLGINISQKEANQRAVLKGRRDYSKVFQSGRNTTARTIAVNGLLGSNAENVIRTLIETTLSKYVNPYEFETIIGLNSRNIIAPLEVDIPIVVISINSNRIYKIAVEIDGLYWHENKSASKKEITLKNRGWLYMPIKYDQKLVNNSQMLVEVADEICKRISAYILGN